MTRILGINLPNFGNSVYVRREPVDHSEIYIDSKLSKLSRQTIADCFQQSNLNSLRQFTSRDKRA